MSRRKRGNLARREAAAAQVAPAASDSPPPVPSGKRKSSHALAALVLVAVTLLPRLLAASGAELRGAYNPSDPDTLRRIVRLRRLSEPQASYPFRDPNDGWYAAPERRGTVLHWTRPMDAVLIGLDRVLGPGSGAPRFVAAACWAGPILGVLTVLAFYAIGSRWLGAPRAFVAALLFSLGYGSVAAGSFGNGDHTALQQLAAVAALLAFLGALAGRRGRGDAVAAGAALGFALWISAESAVLLYAMALASVSALLAAPEEQRGALCRIHLEWSLAALLIAAIGAVVEHAGGLGFEWDLVSGFQLWQLAIFAAFVAAVSMLAARAAARTTAIVGAGLAALAAGLLPMLLLPGWRSAFEEQLRLAGAANRWAQGEIAEYAGLFRVEGFFVPNRAWELLSWLVLALPVCAVVVARERGHSRELRAALLSIAAVLFAFACYEQKLLHLFAVPFALLLVMGSEPLASSAALRFGMPRRSMLAASVVAAVMLLLLPPHPEAGIPSWRLLFDPQARAQTLRSRNDPNLAALIARLRTLPIADTAQRAVLADWPLGADILYGTGLPVVASGYHRNLDGIRDAYRLFAARDPEDNETLAAILRERGVRWIVAKRDSHAFIAGSRAFPELGERARIETFDYIGNGAFHWEGAPTPADTKRSFLWRAAIEGSIGRPLRYGEFEIRPYGEIPEGSLGTGRRPVYIIYEVRTVEAQSG